MEARSRNRRGRAADDCPLERPRSTRFDQLPAERPQERVRNGGDTDRPEPPQVADGIAEERVVREEPNELRVVVVERQDAAQLRDCLFAVTAQPQRPVWALVGGGELRASARTERGREHAVAKAPRGVPGQPC